MNRATVIGIGALFLAGIAVFMEFDSGWCMVPNPPPGPVDSAVILILTVIGVGAIVLGLRSARADRELSEGLGLRDQLHKNK